MKPIVQFIHSYLHLEGCVYLVDIYFQLCLLIFSSESGSLDLGINTKLSWQFPFLFSLYFYSHIIIMALKAKVWINNNELFRTSPHANVWRDLDQFKNELCALMLIVSMVTTLKQSLWGRVPLSKSTRFSRHFLLRNACFNGCLNLQLISQYIIHNDILDYGLYWYIVKLNF